MEPAPIKPKPPLLLTAEAKRQPLHQTIPPEMIGYFIPKSLQIRFSMKNLISEIRRKGRKFDERIDNLKICEFENLKMSVYQTSIFKSPLSQLLQTTFYASSIITFSNSVVS
jgi:hypothetical protein